MRATQALQFLERIKSGLKPGRIRTFREFAEEEIRLPGGPRRNMRYTTKFMPFSREILDEFQRGRFQEFWGSGPVQASKTLHFFIIPALYHLFEIEEDVILGAPVQAQAKSAYLQRMLPVIQKTRYSKFIPEIGPGSRGGVPDLVMFTNGASLRFVGAGGGDHQIASYTARVAIGTELDKMDTAGKVSRESDPVTKLIARTKAFKDAARFYGECTMSTKEGRIWRQVTEFGTDSRVFLPCPYCKTWIWPERAGLIGWQEAPDEMEARRRARFQCPNGACRALWTEDDRVRSMQDPRIVARGQTVNAAGVVEGPMPPTSAYGFRWNAMASPLTRIELMAAEEWRAERSGTEEDEKGVVQHIWAQPWEKKTDLFRPDVEAVLKKIIKLERGFIPPDTEALTMGIDIGFTIWWTLKAWRPQARSHLVDFGSIDVPHKERGERDPLAILNALREFRETTVKAGWGGRQVDMVLIDAGYEQDVIYEFVLESGEPEWLACRGFGTSSKYGLWTQSAAAETTKTREVGKEYKVIVQPAGVKLVAVHADHFRAKVHDGYFAPEGAAGAYTIFHGDPATDFRLRQFARHIIAEQREVVQRPGKEPRIVWVVKSKQNHWLDCEVYARCAAELLGVSLFDTEVEVTAPRGRPASIKKIRSKY
jgi:phage terminase large subunit GpA-like protein